MGRNRNSHWGNRKEKGFKLRRNQLFGPYGIGSIMPCPDGGSLMISGLDAFPTSAMQTVEDQRLAKHIGVSRLLSPPDGGAVPASRFPRWVYCPTCHTMQECKPAQKSPGKCTNNLCKDYQRRDLIPERFIVVCPEGHIDDFPIMEWVHRGPVPDRNHIIKRTTKGGTASLSDIEYKCITCGEKRSLAGATRKGALAEVGYCCKGSQPWLWRTDPEGCKADPESMMVVQRGGTNVWYPDVFNSIYIPDGKDPRLASIVHEKLDRLKEMDDDGKLDAFVSGLADNRNYSEEAIKEVYYDLVSGECRSEMTDCDYKQEEYRTLTLGKLKQKGVFDEVVIDANDYDSTYIKHIADCIGLVYTLRETRALVGFSRLYPDKNEGLSYRKRREQLSAQHKDWTLGIQSIGEGVFIKFKKEVLENWLSNPMVAERFAHMQKHYDEHCIRSSQDKGTLNPLYVLIHTFSHVFILALSKECGYSAASVRERIYCDKTIDENDRHEEMLGLLVYTASSDSEGSLGGLVRAGRPGRLEKIISSAIASASWCSSDPVCIESQGQGPESCNLAACYNCALVPETSCENGNKLLDRGLLVGTLKEKSVGLLSEPTCSIENRSSLHHNANKHSEGVQANNDSSQPDRSPLIDIFPVLDEGYDMSQEGFDAACDRAYEECTSQDEKVFIEKILDVGNGAGVEAPMYLVPFQSADGDIQLDSVLVWSSAKIAIFVGEAANDLLSIAGADSKTKEDWKLLTAYGSTEPADIVKMIVGI